MAGRGSERSHALAQVVCTPVKQDRSLGLDPTTEGHRAGFDEDAIEQLVAEGSALDDDFIDRILDLATVAAESAQSDEPESATEAEPSDDRVAAEDADGEWSGDGVVIEAAETEFDEADEAAQAELDGEAELAGVAQDLEPDFDDADIDDDDLDEGDTDADGDERAAGVEVESSHQPDVVEVVLVKPDSVGSVGSVGSVVDDSSPGPEPGTASQADWIELPDRSFDLGSAIPLVIAALVCILGVYIALSAILADHPEPAIPQAPAVTEPDISQDVLTAVPGVEGIQVAQRCSETGLDASLTNQTESTIVVEFTVTFTTLDGADLHPAGTPSIPLEPGESYSVELPFVPRLVDEDLRDAPFRCLAVLGPASN